MNIFFTSSDPKQCAYDLDDKRGNKIILEVAQMLSTAVQIHNLGLGITPPNLKAHRANFEALSRDVGIYKPTHINHPTNIWIRTTRSNYLWALEHMKELVNVKLLATGKGHKSSELIPLLKKLSSLIPEGELTPFANCAANQSIGLDYKHLEVHEAYRKYLSERWKLDKREPTWYGREEPTWRR